MLKRKPILSFSSCPRNPNIFLAGLTTWFLLFSHLNVLRVVYELCWWRADHGHSGIKPSYICFSFTLTLRVWHPSQIISLTSLVYNSRQGNSCKITFNISKMILQGEYLSPVNLSGIGNAMVRLQSCHRREREGKKGREGVLGGAWEVGRQKGRCRYRQRKGCVCVTELDGV